MVRSMKRRCLRRSIFFEETFRTPKGTRDSSEVQEKRAQKRVTSSQDKSHNYDPSIKHENNALVTHPTVVENHASSRQTINFLGIDVPPLFICMHCDV